MYMSVSNLLARGLQARESALSTLREELAQTKRIHERALEERKVAMTHMQSETDQCVARLKEEQQ